MLKLKKRRFTNLKQQLTPKDKPKAGRCNFPLDGGARFCKLTAGKFTAHPGSGYCKKHDKTGYDPIHRYRGIKQKDIRSQLRTLLSQEKDQFDLLPEIMLMRAMTIDYIERYYEFREALLAWYKDGKIKPKSALDLSDASHLVESITRMIERHHRISQRGSIDLVTFNRAVEMMGIIVAKHVREGKLLEAIEDDWAKISLDAKTPLGLPPAQTSGDEVGDAEGE